MNNQNNSIEQQEQSSQALSIVKLQFNGEKRRFPLEKISMQSLMECITTVGGAHLPKTARIRYIDDEKDLISFSTVSFCFLLLFCFGEFWNFFKNSLFCSNLG